MRISSIGEIALVDLVRERFKGLRRGGLLVGIGDDAAVIKPCHGNTLATTDVMAEGVHFDLSLITPYQLGFKLVSVNVSDIYAMGGDPVQVLVSLAMPPETDAGFVGRFFDGVRDALEKYGAGLAGGDMSSSAAGMTLSAVAIGRAARAVTRSGARPGDSLYVTGPLGDSACGLELLKRLGRAVELGRRGVRGPLGWKTMEPLLRRHLLPEARKPGALAKKASAMMDISDGLAIDLMRLCRESGAGARIYEDMLPVSDEARKACEALGLDPLHLALGGGEDYELLIAAGGPAPRGAVRIGEITRGGGLVMVDAAGRDTALKPEGYRHFES